MTEHTTPRPDGELAVRLQGVTKRFGRGPGAVTALHDVDLEVRRREFVTILGASGCGKSTLLSLIAGLDAPDAGSIDVDGSRVALMFQDATLLPWLTVEQNVGLALKLQGASSAERKDRVAGLLELVRLTGKGGHRPHELSGGMRQRVALARVLAQNANVVLMDEPLGALDAMTRDRMHDEIERLASDLGLTVLFVTHNVREAVRLGDRVILMSSSPGRVKQEHAVGLPRPRRIDSREVTSQSAALTHALREEVSRHVA